MTCDRFRHNNPEGEAAWQEMMANKQLISIDEFLSVCDPSGLFDETVVDEKATLIAENSNDPESHFAKSTINGETVYFMATKGFEFIFKM